MRALSELELVPVWERGEPLGAVGRAATLLAAARPELGAEEAAALTIGERDAELLELRERTFGPQLEAFVACPACGEPLELELDTRRLRQAGDHLPEATLGELELGSYELRYRPLTCADLEAAASTGDVEQARELLVERAVLAAEHDGKPVAPSDLPDEVVAALAERLAAADPRAEILVGLDCPECGHGWRALFDVASFVWSEVGARARRLLEDVAALAAAFGWTESEILALTPLRRRHYLELAV